MTESSVRHATFAIERIYPAAPEKVFRAWANAEAKAKWFSKPDEFDFRIGGREFSRGGPPGGPVFTFDAQYQEIAADRRIVYTYTLDQDEKRISVSVTTVEFQPLEAGTRLVFTEQGVFLDGLDTPEQREQGTKEMLDALGASLAQ